jgi:hypothetical protein
MGYEVKGGDDDGNPTLLGLVPQVSREESGSEFDEGIELKGAGGANVDE